MKRKRFIKLLMGQLGFSRNAAVRGADAVVFMNTLFVSDPDRPTFKSMYTVLLINKGALLK